MSYEKAWLLTQAFLQGFMDVSVSQAIDNRIEHRCQDSIKQGEPFTQVLGRVGRGHEICGNQCSIKYCDDSEMGRTGGESLSPACAGWDL